MTQLADIPEAAATTLGAASPLTSASFTITNTFSGSFSINMMLCLVATESLSNMQYLNINHSNIASTFYSGMSSSYIPNWIASFNTIDRERAIFPWGTFEKSQISSLFLDNFGDSLTENMVNSGLFLFAIALILSMQTEKAINSFARKAYLTTFGLFASNIFGKLQSQLLYSILQILRMDLFLDTYSRMSVLAGYFTLSFTIGLLVHCFFKLLTIFHNKANLGKNIPSSPLSHETPTQTKWLEKQYEFLFDDFKSTQKNQFFFTYLITAFNTIYILLIIALQSVPILQCLSIVVLVLAFILFPAIIRPFKTILPAFLHYFNFSCLLVVAILNLALAIIQYLTPDFSGTETQGKVVISVISLNIGMNSLVSVGIMISEIYNKCKSCAKSDTGKKQKEIMRITKPLPPSNGENHNQSPDISIHEIHERSTAPASSQSVVDSTLIQIGVNRELRIYSKQRGREESNRLSRSQIRFLTERNIS